MSDLLIDKLQHLEATLRDVRKHYHIQYTELKSLKSKPLVDVSQLNQLKLQLAEVKNAQRNITQERDSLQQRLDTLTTEHKSLTEAHQTLEVTYSDLLAQFEQLQSNNAMLQEKNRTAAASTKVVLKRLTQIDNTIE